MLNLKLKYCIVGISNLGSLEVNIDFIAVLTHAMFVQIIKHVGIEHGPLHRTSTLINNMDINLEHVS